MAENKPEESKSTVSSTSTSSSKGDSKYPKPGEPKVEIKTADDAVQAYLRGHIEEQELRDALASFGVVTLAKKGVERVDAAYERKIPDDLFEEETSPYDDYEYRKGLVDEKEEEREKASKQAETESKKTEVKTA